MFLLPAFTRLGHECQDLLGPYGLYSHPKEFGGIGVRSHVNSQGKIPSSGGSEEDRTHDVASRRTANPTHYRLSYSGRQLVFSILCIGCDAVFVQQVPQAAQYLCPVATFAVLARLSACRLPVNRLVGLVVKVSASRADDPGLESLFRRDFSGVESYQ